tara:strand:- start:1470 stop:2087 length:618 start_codon:yes stop_codon:yes gene_type:complete
MESLILGFLTGGSLILAIGPQNLFVIEQGLKKNFVFIVTSICAISDVLLIFLGIFIYQSFGIISGKIIILLNILLIFFLINFIKDKLKDLKKNYNIRLTRSKNRKNVILKTLGFTYLNPHVYSDTVFILGNFSKNFSIINKLYFALGASSASILFFYSLGYLASSFKKFVNKQSIWRYINTFIIIFMVCLIFYIINDSLITYSRI